MPAAKAHGHAARPALIRRLAGFGAATDQAEAEPDEISGGCITQYGEKRAHHFSNCHKPCNRQGNEDEIPNHDAERSSGAIADTPRCRADDH